LKQTTFRDNLRRYARIEGGRAAFFAERGHVKDAGEYARRAASLAVASAAPFEGKSAFHHIVRECDRIAWPDSYVADVVVHDRNHIKTMEREAKDAGRPLLFVWTVRDTGTHMIDPFKRDWFSWFAAIEKQTTSAAPYVFDGTELKQVSWARAREFCYDARRKYPATAQQAAAA